MPIETLTENYGEVADAGLWTSLISAVSTDPSSWLMRADSRDPHIFTCYRLSSKAREL
jgi:hypothetical protein